MPALSRFLRYFMVVGRTGSIRKAADELNVSASAIDRQILNAEAELGMPLFERLPGGLRLTAAGELMMGAGSRWQKGLGDVLRQLEDLRGLKRGHVEIALIHALTRGRLPDVLAALHQRHPGITLGLRVLDSEEIRAAVAEGQVDFGLCFEPQSIRDITVHAFAEMPLGFVSLPDHPIAQRPAQRFASCSGWPIILPAAPLAVAQQVRVLQGTAQVPLERVAEADNVQLMISLVRRGLGVGVLSRLDVESEVAAGDLAFTPISDPVLKPLTLALCTATARTPSLAADMVLGEIQQAFGAWNAGL